MPRQVVPSHLDTLQRSTSVAPVSSSRLCTTRRKEKRKGTLGLALTKFTFNARGTVSAPPTAAAHLGPPGGGLEGHGSGRQRRRDIHTGTDRSRDTDRSSAAADAAENKVKETKDIRAISVHGIRCTSSLTHAPRAAPGRTLLSTAPTETEEQSPAAAQPPGQMLSPRPEIAHPAPAPRLPL